jgi:hypothetical protein
MILLVSLYWCETLSLILRDEHRLSMVVRYLSY